MKKISMLFFVALLALTLVACKADENIAVATFDVEGNETIVEVIKGHTVNLNFIPNTDRITYEFIGWYLEDELIDVKTFIIKEDIRLIAKYKDLMPEMIIESKTFTYNGEIQTLSVVNMPTEFTINYSNNENVDAGIYTVTGDVYQGDQYARTLEGTLTITPKDIELSLVDKEFKFDGEVKKLDDIINLKEYMNIIYIDNDIHIYPGVYNVGALVYGNDQNYTYNRELFGKLKIYYEVNFHNRDGIETVKNFNTWLEDHNINTEHEGYVFKGFFTDVNFTKEVKDKEYLNGHTDIYMKYEKVGA